MFENLTQKRQPAEGEIACPYDGVAYRDVPGYVEGYGCPVCKAISFHHLPVRAPNVDELLFIQWWTIEQKRSMNEPHEAERAIFLSGLKYGRTYL